MTARRTPNSRPLVLKFGGSAFADLDGYHRVARYAVRRSTEEQRPLVVVVSAMSGTTGRLQETLDALSADPPAHAAAMLLTTGETVSVALLAAALDAEGVPACPLPAGGTGLLAEGPADRAGLTSASSEALSKVLADCPIAVVPGGQAVDAAGRTVMLGRNSSDLSAAATAATLGADTCEIFSDVPGVCTADPHLVPEARTLSRISYEGVRRMSRHGAKVVHEGAVDWAERGGVRLLCRPFPWSEDPEGGTAVGTGPEAAAVVVHKDSEVWCFRSGRERRVVAGRLRAEGLGGTEFDTASEACLTVPAGARGAPRHLRTARRLDGLCLVTTLRADGRTEHAVVPRSDAAAEARRRHVLLYPDSAGTSGPAVPAPAKARSPHSDVLVGPGPPPAPENKPLD
ncbi:aspartate kinase [Streptomyces sp. Wb2n-11]|uniref:amino acid kinase family protein n=1 Tax=Streptomyces sp. Wb2n-11 TaxID=1030533 RepID=UPI000AA7E217|nr:aspartate kinase [Streptomyces sp. Wb2n-11]